MADPQRGQGIAKRITLTQWLGGIAVLLLAALLVVVTVRGNSGAEATTTAAAAQSSQDQTSTPSATATPTSASTLTAEQQLARRQQLQQAAQARADARASESATAAASASAAAEAAAAAKAAFLEPSTFAELGDRDYEVMLKDPQAHVGEKYVVHGCVTQFDSITGPTAFRANTSGEGHKRCYEYSSNTIVTAAEPGILDRVVKDDLVTMYVVVQGVTSYQTSLGGALTVPVLTVHKIDVTGAS